MMLVMEDIGIGIGLLALLLVALELGFRIGRRMTAEGDPRATGQVGAIQGAMLGLLGLLLGFSFAAAGSRFLEKQDLIVKEANAIGTAYLRADLLVDSHKSELRAALKHYTEYRIEISREIPTAFTPDAHAAFERQHNRIWSAAVAGVMANTATMQVVLPPVNEVIDLHATRIAAGKKHLPRPVMSLLIACSVLAMGVMGYGSGIGGRRRAPLTVSLALLIAGALWITIDLDHPRAGVLRLSDAPLRELTFVRSPG